MVAANIQVTQGSGTRLATSSYTEGGVTVHDEKVILGETYLPTYNVGQSTSASTATANSHLAQLMAGASLKVRVRHIRVFQFTAATTAALMDLSILRLTTAGTGGTTETPAPLDPSDSASGATFMTLPTVKGAESTRVDRDQPLLIQTIPASPGQGRWLIADFDYDRPRQKPLIIPAGTTNGICLKNVTAHAAAVVIAVITFDESSF